MIVGFRGQKNLRAAPLVFVAPALLVAAFVVIPFAYLLAQAFQAEPSKLADLVFRARNARLFVNTLLLAGGVLAVGTAIALPLAWLTARTDIRGRRLLTALGVLPLAIPGYVIAYALLGLGGDYGLFAQLTAVSAPQLSGYWGSLLAISLYTFPYLFLNLRAALLGLDPCLEEAAQSLGAKRARVVWRVILPQLKPAYAAGALIVMLYVVGDFGAVSLMRFETFSYALYMQYAAAYDRVYAAWLALMLLGMTITLLVLEYRVLRGLALHRLATGTARPATRRPLGAWRYPAYLFAGLVALCALIVPTGSVVIWLARSVSFESIAALGSPLWASVSVAAPSAILAASLALPITYLSIRHPSVISRVLERLAYLGYATPPLALALALIVFSLAAMPALYQTLALLIAAYTLHFLAEAIGPVRSALYQASPAVEEAARSLGCSQLAAFRRATLPLLRGGLVAATALVFLSAMKELPIAFLLAPAGFETLALGVWSYTNEAMFAAAAPYALAILVFSSLFVSLLLRVERRR